MYYSSDKLFSRQSQINFIMGERGNGKSFEAKKRMIKNFINKKEQSIYIRRRETDIDEVKEFFFDDIKEFFPNNVFEIKGRFGYIDGEIAIIFIALSTSLKKKSSPFPRVTLLVFDEYIEPAFKFPNYLKNDMFYLFELISTVVRKRDNWKLLLIGNAISYVNPFFTMFDIEIKDQKQRFHSFRKDEADGNYMITVELTETPEYKEEFAKTKLAKLTKNTSYGDYSMNAVAYEDNNEFIKDRTKGQYYFVCTIKVNNSYIGVWIHEEGYYYIDDILDSTNKHKYVIFAQDIEEGYKLFKNDTKTWRTRKLKEKYNNGEMFYKNQEIKKLFINDISKYI